MDGVEYLLTARGRDLLESMPPYDPTSVVALSQTLRKAGYEPDLVSAALTQQKLRAKAALKFGADARDMLFTEVGAQQATRSLVADLHAKRYVDAGCHVVADITCGIGSDSRALARAGLAVIAADLDRAAAACAIHNLSPFLGEQGAFPSHVGVGPRAQVAVTDGLCLDFSAVDGIFADPGRRRGSGRTFNPNDYSPPLGDVLDLRRQVDALGVKVAPGITYAALPKDAHVQWISVDGDVVEAGLWFGALAAGPGRSALVISGDEQVEVSAATDPREPVALLEPRPLGRYIYAPDGAVIRAGALETVARQLNAGPVSERIAYLTGDELVRTPLATTFEVLESMPLKRLRGYLKDRKIGSLEILKRGVDIVPDQFRKSLHLRGAGEATVVLTRLQGRHSAVMVQRAHRDRGTGPSAS